MLQTLYRIFYRFSGSPPNVPRVRKRRPAVQHRVSDRSSRESSGFLDVLELQLTHAQCGRELQCGSYSGTWRLLLLLALPGSWEPRRAGARMRKSSFTASHA
jgi:hypothetical protein